MTTLMHKIPDAYDEISKKLLISGDRVTENRIIGGL